MSERALRGSCYWLRSEREKRKVTTFWYEVGGERLEGHTCRQGKLCLLSAYVAPITPGQGNPQEENAALASIRFLSRLVDICKRMKSKSNCGRGGGGTRIGRLQHKFGHKM